jgi:hypothetical protein
LPSSEDELEETNGSNPVDIEIDPNKESKKEVCLYLLALGSKCQH